MLKKRRCGGGEGAGGHAARHAACHAGGHAGHANGAPNLLRRHELTQRLPRLLAHAPLHHPHLLQHVLLPVVNHVLTDDLLLVPNGDRLEAALAMPSVALPMKFPQRAVPVLPGGGRIRRYQ